MATGFRFIDLPRYRGDFLNYLKGNYPARWVENIGFVPSEDYCTEVMLSVYDRLPLLVNFDVDLIIPYVGKEKTLEEMCRIIRNVDIRRLYVQLGSTDDYADFNRRALEILRDIDFSPGLKHPRRVLHLVKFYVRSR